MWFKKLIFDLRFHKNHGKLSFSMISVGFYTAMIIISKFFRTVHDPTSTRAHQDADVTHTVKKKIALETCNHTDVSMSQVQRWRWGHTP